MKTKILLTAILVLILSSGAFAFTPAPCVPNTECDCQIEFCTYEQFGDYVYREKVKDIFGLIGSAFGKSTMFDVYIYGSFPVEWRGRSVSRLDKTILGYGPVGKWVEEYNDLESVSGFHLYKAKVDPFFGWNKVRFPGGFTVPNYRPEGVIFSFGVSNADTPHISAIKANPVLEQKFKNACDAWRGKIEPWPCIGLFDVGELTIRRAITGKISPAAQVADIYITGPSSGNTIDASINAAAGTFTISPVEAGVAYKLTALAKQGSNYMDWAENVIVAADKDAQLNITLQPKPSATQSTGKGTLRIELVSENGAKIAGAVAYNILTNPDKVERADVLAEGLTKADLPAGNYKFVITPKEQKYVPNPQTIYSFSVNSNTTNTLKVTFNESGAPVNGAQPPAGAKTGTAYYRFNAEALVALKEKGISTNYNDLVSVMKVNDGAIKISVFNADGKDAIKFENVSSRVKYKVTFNFPGYKPILQEWEFEDGDIN